MSVQPNDPKLVFMSLADVLSAQGECMVIRDHWWSIDPERGLIFWQSEKKRAGQLRGASPQCNRAESTARLLQGKLYPWATVHLVPLVIQPIHLGDYA